MGQFLSAKWVKSKPALTAIYYFTLSAYEEGIDYLAWLDCMNPEYDNLRAALAWSQTTTGDLNIAFQLTDRLSELHDSRGFRQESIVLLERTLNHPLGVGRTKEHAAARISLGYNYALTGNYPAAQAQFEQVLELAHELGDMRMQAEMLERLGWVAREQGDDTLAWERLVGSLAVARELGEISLIPWILNTMAGLAILNEDPARAEALLAESRIEAAQSAYDPILHGWTLNHLGQAAQLSGTYDRATQLHHESLALFPSLYHSGLSSAYLGLGESSIGKGRPNEAARWLRQALEVGWKVSDQAGIVWSLAGLGSVAALDGQPERAARLWGAAERLRQAIGCRPAPAARATYERAQEVARAQLGETAFAAAWAEGQRMPLEQAIVYALENGEAEAASSSQA